MPGPRWEGALRASAEAYKTVNPDATVNILVNPFTEHYQKIGTELASDSDATDVYVFDAALLGQSQAKLLPLTDLIASDPTWQAFYEEGVPAAYRDSWSWEGVPLAVVHDANCMMAWRRTDIFEENGLPEPTTFEIMLENADEAERDQGGQRVHDDGHGRRLPGGPLHRHDARVRRQVVENDIPDAFGRISAEKPPGAVLLDSAENIAAMTMLRDLVAAGPEASLNAQEFENNEAFKNDLVYQQLMWSGLMVLQTEKENPEYWDKLASSPIPDRRLATPTRTRRGSRAGSASRSRRPPRTPSSRSTSPSSSPARRTPRTSSAAAVSRRTRTLLNGVGRRSRASRSSRRWPPASSPATTRRSSPRAASSTTSCRTPRASVLTGEKEPADGCADMKKNTEDMLKRAGYV